MQALSETVSTIEQTRSKYDCCVYILYQRQPIGARSARRRPIVVRGWWTRRPGHARSVALDGSLLRDRGCRRAHRSDHAGRKPGQLRLATQGAGPSLAAFRRVRLFNSRFHSSPLGRASGAAGERVCFPATTTGDDASRLNRARMRRWRRPPAIVNASLTAVAPRRAPPSPARG